MVRVRFAPSPTGNLHIGTVRTALFNWLYAKSQKGVCLLRIEDTDLARSESQYEGNILEGLKWLGLTMDEGPETGGEYGPYRQSERIKEGIYETYCNQLLETGHAYYAFETEEELDQEREEAKQNNIPYVYSRKSLSLTKEEVQQKLANNAPYVIRFKMPDTEKIEFSDIIRGPISFETKLISDFVIMKSDGSPSYNFAVVVDDAGMKITHVIRGEDHISNTPKQIAIFNALHMPIPKFAHMPMILGPDKSKLSKRHGATSVTEYGETGFLGEAMFNFLCLLGWAPPGEKELLTKEEIIQAFTLERISKSNAIFDTQKLTWMNGQYIRQLSPNAYIETVKPYLNKDVQEALTKHYTPETQNDILLLLQDTVSLWPDINQTIAVFCQSENDVKEKQGQHINSEDLPAIQEFKTQLQAKTNLSTEQDYLDLLDSVVTTLNVGKGKVFRPVRIAATGDKSGPDIGRVLAILGRETLLKRLSYL